MKSAVPPGISKNSLAGALVFVLPSRSVHDGRTSNNQTQPQTSEVLVEIPRGKCGKKDNFVQKKALTLPLS